MTNLKQLATRSIGRTSLILKKYSPEILTGVGIASGVAAGVLAVRATLKVEPVIEKIQEDLAKVNDLQENSENLDPKVVANLKGRVYGIGLLELTKLYWPAVSLGAASIGCIIGAHGIMKKRNAALVVAYNAVEKSFSEYRDRVASKLGEDEEKSIRYNVQESEVVDEETGKKKVVTTVGNGHISPYAKFFDEYSQYWDRNAEYNLIFLRAQQNYANDRLNARGHLFLNEVYESLGIPHTQAGAVVGWTISKDGDNFVDFGIYDISNDKAREFVNGIEKSILLDFNVDGVIYDKIDE